MTDNEIMKALECCKDADCLNCPRLAEELCFGLGSNLVSCVLDLINRQKEEIEHYKKAFFNSQNIFSDQALENECMKAEIDSMKEKLKLYSYYKEPFVKQIKSEAIKEFAEKLKANLDISVYGYSTEEVTNNFFDTIDNLVKEMTEDEK